MIRRHLSWLLPVMGFCAVPVLAYLHVRPPAALPNGQAAETREAFENRKAVMSAVGESLPDSVHYDSAEARKLATRESLDALKARLAITTVTYDFQWRTHASQEAVAALDASDATFEAPSDNWPRETTLERPGVWKAIATRFAVNQTSDVYIIRVGMRQTIAVSLLRAQAGFQVPASADGAGIELTCSTSRPVPSEPGYGYCYTPATNKRANAEADAQLLDRLASLQVEGPSPTMTTASITLDDNLVAASGVLAEQARKEEQYQARERAQYEARQSTEQMATYTIYAIGGLILFGLPGLALVGAIKARRSRGARNVSGVYGVICIGMVLAAVYGIGQVGPWGLLVAIGLGLFALVAGVSALIALVGAACGVRE